MDFYCHLINIIKLNLLFLCLNYYGFIFPFQTIKSRMQNELATIIQSTTRQMLDMHPSPGTSEDHDSYITGLHRRDSREAKLLQELLQVPPLTNRSSLFLKTNTIRDFIIRKV